MKRDLKAELRTRSVEELEAQVHDAREQMLRGRVTQAVDSQRAGMEQRRLRRDIARCLTVINEKRRASAAEVK